MNKYITISNPVTKPSKEQSLLERIVLSPIKSILGNLKNGVEDSDAVTLGQVKELLKSISGQSAIVFGGFPNYYLGADGEFHPIIATGTVISTDPVLNGVVNGTKDSVNTAFTTDYDFLPGTLMLIRNGQFDHEITESSGNAFTITNPPSLDESLVVIYCRYSQRTVLNGVITGTQDGANTTFDVAYDYEPGSLMLIRNGQFDHEIVEDVSPTTTFTITNPPESDEILYAIYKKL